MFACDDVVGIVDIVVGVVVVSFSDSVNLCVLDLHLRYIIVLELDSLYIKLIPFIHFG